MLDVMSSMHAGARVMSEAPPAILQQLARGTSDMHARIERCVPLLDANLHIDTYDAYLEAMLGFYEPFEAVLAGFGWHRVGLDFLRRRKTYLIVRDLRHLGHDDRMIAAIPRCRDLPRPTDLLQALGCLYVLEGATLGGHVLTRRVKQSLGLSPASGCAFLASYGKDVGPMWRAFGSALARAMRADNAQEMTARSRMVAAARDTFFRLERWLVHGSPEGVGFHHG